MMAAERVRSVEFPRPFGAADLSDVQREASARDMAAKVLPEWVRGSILLEGVACVSGTVVQVPHGLGRKHRGWIVVLTTLAAGHESLSELAPTDASYLAALADTHLQLLPTATCSASIVVF